MALVRASTRGAARLLQANSCIFRPFSSGTPASHLKPLGIPDDPPHYEHDNDSLKEQIETLKIVKSNMEKYAWRLPKSHPRRREFMEIYYQHPFAVDGSKCHFYVKEDDYAVYARVDMPGVDNKGVRVWMEKDSHLHFEGVEAAAAAAISTDLQGVDDNDDFCKPRKFANRIYLPSGGRYNTDDIKANIHNGVLRIVVSKIKA